MVEDRHFIELKLKHEALENKFEEYVNKKNEEETRRLRTALLAAGGVILALGGFLWWEVIWPVIKVGRK